MKPFIPRTARAFIMTDFTIGLAMALLLLMLMTTTLVKQHQQERTFEKIRTAARNAEAAMLALHAGQPAPPNARIDVLPDPAPGAGAYHWVRITLPASNDLPASSLVGLVPAEAPAAGENRP